MGCCGSARQQLASVGRRRPADSHRPARRFTITFEYRGASALSVTGPASGRRYRFEHAGARLVVDPRDRPHLARVPHLSEVE